jgi:two-component system response regulator (stage 0 sporulation protein F)
MLGKKIVVVDDEESIRKTFFLLLNTKYRVYPAKDAEEVLDKFKGLAFDLIIADLRLPGRDGVELITELRRLGYRGEVILISAHAELVDPSKLSRLRIGHFFAKPLDLNALSRSIDYLLTKDEGAQPRA